MAQKPHAGYEKKKQLNKTKKPIFYKFVSSPIMPLKIKKKVTKKFKKINSESLYLSSIIIPNGKHYKMGLVERVIKLIIYVALRIVILPRHWKDPQKNINIINKTYSRIMSSDFIYIPSSLAFYIIIAFMPIMSLIMAFNSIDFIRDLMVAHRDASGNIDKTYIEIILGRFIPGIGELLSQIHGITEGGSKLLGNIGGAITIISSLVVSTWIAAGGFAKIIYTQSYIYEHKYVGSYLANKIKGLLMVISFTLFLALVLIINVGFEHMYAAVGWSTQVVSVVRYVFLSINLIVMVFLGFVILYRFSPRYKTKIRWILPGAMTSTIPTVLFFVLFGTISSIWSYGRFGSIGVIMYIGAAALIITYFIFVGIIVNSSFHKTHVGDVEKKWTISRK